MCYVAQVLGTCQYEEVEKLLRYFHKKIFRLLENTLSYMVHLKTGLRPLCILTLRLLLLYIL